MGDPSRRSVCLGLAALAAAAGAAGPMGAASADARPRPRPALAADPAPRIRPAPRPDSGYHAWVAQFRARAEAAGIGPSTFDRAFAGARYLPRILETDRAQMRARHPLEEQIARTASAARVRIGATQFKRHRRLLDRVEARFGVDAAVLAAIWGVESGYGASRGETPVISALSTLGYGAPRAAFFEDQLLAALAIVAAGDIAPERMLGSWAGAMGHTQFMPATYLAHAVDFDDDGRRDIWSDDPADALASAAGYLAASGWVPGGLWGLEVWMPETHDDLVTLPVSAWVARGVTRAGGGVLPDHGPAELILPNGAGGPAFLLFANYRVLRQYNDSMKYALGVGHLADRLGGGGALVGRRGMTEEVSFADRQDLQARLTHAGFDTGGADGVIGDRTTAAIRAYEAAQGLPVTGLASRALLARLRRQEQAER